ncbi:MAG: hypothetical protein KatS3mg103_0223 [Phycisphaerales bacterium]|nr:MAG: hypothetical protein KatS3mg103_0223 [Phycisphaerales bacterium]
MSPIDPRELEPREARPAERPKATRCLRCGYELVGLPVGVPCPECGTPNGTAGADARGRQSGVDAAPLAYVQRLRLWLWGMAVSLVGMWLAGVAQKFIATTAVSFEPVVAVSLVRTLVGGAWVVALWMATKPKPDRGHGRELDDFDDPRWRMATMATQCLWPVAFLLESLAWMPAFYGYEDVLMLGSTLATFLAAMGFVPLGVMLVSLADWMGDTDEQGRLRAATWLIAFHGVGVLLSQFVRVLMLLLLVYWVAYLVGVVLLALGLISLARSANWAVQNHQHKLIVSGRRAMIEQERARQALERVEAHVQHAQTKAEPDARTRLSPQAGNPPAPRTHGIDQPQDARPYDLADE